MTECHQQNEAAIVALLDQPADKTIDEMVEKLSKRRGVAAVLFYGNKLREVGADGLLDFYVLTDGNKAYHGAGFSAFFNKILPPNVYFEEITNDTGSVSAKVAVMTLSAFRRKMSPKSWDTTLWARFSQPARLVYCRDEESRADVIEVITSAYETAIWWAFRLSSNTQSATALWTDLFSKTYGAELRVESANRAEMIVAKAPELYQSLYQAFVEDTSKYPIAEGEHDKAHKQWARRRMIGKVQNLLRLIKAAVTFRGGIAYALSKVERHSGRAVELKPWERRFPWIAAPLVFCRLLIERRLR